MLHIRMRYGVDPSCAQAVGASERTRLRRYICRCCCSYRVVHYCCSILDFTCAFSLHVVAVSAAEWHIAWVECAVYMHHRHMLSYIEAWVASRDPGDLRPVNAGFAFWHGLREAEMLDAARFGIVTAAAVAQLDVSLLS